MPETGQVVQIHSLPSQYFGEGLARWADRLLQLTWQSRIGFVYDLHSFKLLHTFRYDTEGWGLTEDGDSLIMSDGSSVLRFLDPETYREKGRLEVRRQGAPMERLNELEYVRGHILANVWEKDVVLRISPSSGEVLQTLDLSRLRSSLGPVSGPEVLNGIAYDREGDRIFVTGKLWPKVFEIEIPELKP
jgi:glutamine cyclotransferase